MCVYGSRKVDVNATRNEKLKATTASTCLHKLSLSKAQMRSSSSSSYRLIRFASQHLFPLLPRHSSKLPKHLIIHSWTKGIKSDGISLWKQICRIARPIVSSRWNLSWTTHADEHLHLILISLRSCGEVERNNGERFTGHIFSFLAKEGLWKLDSDRRLGIWELCLLWRHFALRWRLTILSTAIFQNTRKIHDKVFCVQKIMKVSM